MSSDHAAPQSSGAVKGGVPSPIANAMFHHLRQHAGTMLDKASKGRCLVFYMELKDVVVEGDVAVSNGRGMFTGPLRAETASERDTLVAALPGMPADFRAELNRADCLCLVAVKVIENGGKQHSLTVALGEEVLQGMRREQAEN